MSELSAHERIVLSVNTRSEREAERHVEFAEQVNAKYVLFGSVTASATSWDFCAELAEVYKREWIADPKLYDAPDVVGETVMAIRGVDYKPFGITVHASASREALEAAWQVGYGMIFGVTGLPSLSPEEHAALYGGATADRRGLMLALRAARTGIGGVLATPYELAAIKGDPTTKNLLTMVDGVYSPALSLDVEPEYELSTVLDAVYGGADLVVMGRQILDAHRPELAFQRVTAEIARGLAARPT